MTDSNDTNRPTSTETISENNPAKTFSREPWDREDTEYDKPDATEISNPPDQGVDYYNRLINLDTCSYTYLRDGSHLQLTWQGEIHDIDEFRTALYQLYKSTYKSDLSAADLRPKAFQTFADKATTEEIKKTFHKKPVEKSPRTHNPARHDNRITERIADTLHSAAALACKHRTQLGQQAQPKDTVLNSVLPDSVHEQST